MKSGEIKCSKCGNIIGQLPTTIAEDIRRGGGMVIGGNSLDIPMYKCTICPGCGSAFCLSCHRDQPLTHALNVAKVILVQVLQI